MLHSHSRAIGDQSVHTLAQEARVASTAHNLNNICSSSGDRSTRVLADMGDRKRRIQAPQKPSAELEFPSKEVPDLYYSTIVMRAETRRC